MLLRNNTKQKFPDVNKTQKASFGYRMKADSIGPTLKKGELVVHLSIFMRSLGINENKTKIYLLISIY